jgi:hypothetical protein
MSHVASHHCGGVGEIVGEIAISSGGNTKPLPKYSRLNLAIALNTEGLTHEEAERLDRKIMKYRMKIYNAVAQAGETIHAAPPTHHDWY